jgi:hypothetical protein
LYANYSKHQVSIQCCGRVESNKSLLSTENKLFQVTNISERCELVILCEEDVENVIGKSILLGLREAFTLTDNPSLMAIEKATLEDMVLSLDQMSTEGFW